MSKRGRRPGAIQVVKDLASYVAGMLIIFKQAGILFAPPLQVSDSLILLAIVLIGVPGASQLLLARFGKGTSTAEPPRRPAPQRSPASLSGELPPTD